MFDDAVFAMQELERARVQERFEGLFEPLSEHFYDADLMNLNGSGNLPCNEYDLEVCTILPGLIKCGGVEDVRALIVREFLAWFGGTDISSHPRLDATSRGTWELWCRWRAWRSLW